MIEHNPLKDQKVIEYRYRLSFVTILVVRVKVGRMSRMRTLKGIFVKKKVKEFVFILKAMYTAEIF